MREWHAAAIAVSLATAGDQSSGKADICAFLSIPRAGVPNPPGGLSVNQILAPETAITIVFGCVFLLLVIGFACMFTA